MSIVCLSVPTMSNRHKNPQKNKLSSSRQISLSFGDLYGLAEKHHQRSKRHTRRHTVDTASSRSPTELLSPLPELSTRPVTTVSEPLLSSLDISHENQSLHVSLPATPMSCIRSDSMKNEEYYRIVTSLCRQCCDVLGPKVCRECAKVQQRQNLLFRASNLYKNLEISESNVTATTTLKRYLPHMTTVQIQNTIATGQVARHTLESELTHRRELVTLLNKEMHISENNRPIRRTKVALERENVTQTFFHGVNDLNKRIVSGEVPKDLKTIMNALGSNEPKRTLPSAGTSKNNRTSFSELVCPAFVSARKTIKEKPVYSAYYKPPLLPLHMQNVEPMFFAGSQTQYKLPDRLPDKMVCDDDEYEPDEYTGQSPVTISRDISAVRREPPSPNGSNTDDQNSLPENKI